MFFIFFIDIRCVKCDILYVINFVNRGSTPCTQIFVRGIMISD